MTDIVKRLRQMAESISYSGQASLEFARAAHEIETLRRALVRYGDPVRMSSCGDQTTQRVIDDAFEQTPPARDRFEGLLTSGERQEMQEEQSGARYLASRKEQG